MAPAIPFIMAGLAVMQMASSMIGNAQQNSATQKAAKEEQKLIEAQTSINQANAAKQNDLVLAKNQARSEAAGISSLSGSPLEHDLAQAYNAGLQEASIRWEGDVRKRNVKLAAKQAQQEYKAAQTQAAIKGVTSIVSSFAGGGGAGLGNWFRTANSSFGTFGKAGVTGGAFSNPSFSING